MLLKQFQDVGTDEQLAEAVVTTLDAVVSEHVATKTDIATAKADLTARLKRFELRMMKTLYVATSLRTVLIKTIDFLIGSR